MPASSHGYENAPQEIQEADFDFPWLIVPHSLPDGMCGLPIYSPA